MESFILQRKFLIFLRNDCDCKVFKQNQLSRHNKKTDTTAQLHCTLSTYDCTISLYVTPKTISRQNQKNQHNTTTIWYSKYIAVCTTKTYFPPEPKTDTTAQLEKKVPPAHAKRGQVRPAHAKQV
jgi:hypothetical protein